MSQSQQPQQQPQQPRRGSRAGYAFKRSTWITAIWNWFLMLAGKAAEPVLTISVIYSCARLLPAIHMPVQLDNTIFICQMVALDIGGLGLRKLANQARKDNNEEGARLAGGVSTALLVIMGINVALSVLESIAPLDPNFVKVAEGILLIARAVMAVLYAFVIHTLHSEPEGGEPGGNGGGQPHNDPPFQPIRPEDLQRALAEQRAAIDQQIQAIAVEQARLLPAIQQLQQLQAQPAPAVDTQTIVAEVVNHLDGRFASTMKHLATEVERRVRVSLVNETGQGGTYGSVSPARSGTNSSVSPTTSGTLPSGPKLVPLPQRTISSQPAKSASETQQLNRETDNQSQNDAGEITDAKSAIYKQLDQDNALQVADLQRITGLPKTTVWRWYNRYHEENRARIQGRVVAGSVEPAATEETA